MATLNTIPRFIASTRPGCPDAYLVLRDPAAPVLFAVHGIARGAAEMATRFAADPAFAGWNIVAPLFDKDRFGQYQQLMARPGQTRSDLGLLALADAMAADRGLDCDRLALFGFSGGAQFVHRFAMLHPARVRAAVAASAGWYLMPGLDLPWPYGLGEGTPVAVRRRAALAVPITVMVGDQDMRIDGSVRQTPMINAHQGDTRLRRAKRWAKAMERASGELGRTSCVKLRLLPGGVHDFGICARDTALMTMTADAVAQPVGEEWPLSA